MIGKKDMIGRIGRNHRKEPMPKNDILERNIGKPTKLEEIKLLDLISNTLLGILSTE